MNRVQTKSFSSWELKKHSFWKFPLVNETVGNDGESPDFEIYIKGVSLLETEKYVLTYPGERIVEEHEAERAFATVDFRADGCARSERVFA